MNVTYRYNNADRTIALPAAIDFSEVSDKESQPLITTEQLLAFVSATEQCSLLDAPRPLFVVNDGYRNTPTAVLLGMLESCKPGLLARSRFLISTGTHPAPTEHHLRAIFGLHLETVRSAIFWHDCTDISSMTAIGVDRFGLPFYLNSLAAQSSATIVIGSVEPHYFAGLTGGRKSFFPGLTDFATVERNHNLASSLDCRPLRLDGNPVADHLEELMDAFPTDHLLSLQAVLDSKERIVGLCCGSLAQSFQEAVFKARELYAHPIAHPYDLVIAELLPPLDRNLYQAQKALENCQAGVRDGGAVVVVAACPEGIGSDHFYQLAQNWDSETNLPIDGKPRFGSHKLSRVNALSRRIRVLLLSELDPTIAQRVFYEPSPPLDSLIAELANRKPGARVALVRNAGHAVLLPN